MHMICCALFCFVFIIILLEFLDLPIFFRVSSWFWNNHIIAPVTVMWPCRLWVKLMITKPPQSINHDSRLAPSQWETSLQSNAVSHWLGANLESILNHMHNSWDALWALGMPILPLCCPFSYCDAHSPTVMPILPLWCPFSHCDAHSPTVIGPVLRTWNSHTGAVLKIRTICHARDP